TSIAKMYGGPMGYGRLARARTMSQMSQCLRSLVFGAVCPKEGKGAALIMPACNTEAMNLHLAEIAATVAPAAHAILLVDQAGWHLSRTTAVRLGPRFSMDLVGSDLRLDVNGIQKQFPRGILQLLAFYQEPHTLEEGLHLLAPSTKGQQGLAEAFTRLLELCEQGVLVPDNGAPRSNWQPDLLVHFEADLAPAVRITTEPASVSRRNHWRTALWLLPSILKMHGGVTLSARLGFRNWNSTFEILLDQPQR